MAFVQSENDPVAVINLMGDDSAPALLLCLTALGVNDLNKQHRWANAGVLGAFLRKLIPQLTHATFAFTFIIIQIPILKRWRKMIFVTCAVLGLLKLYQHTSMHFNMNVLNVHNFMHCFNAL